MARRQALALAEARIDQAATRLTRAGIALAEAERNLADTTLEAPFDGTLSDTAVVEGGLIAANERLADLIDPDDLEVSFRVSTVCSMRRASLFKHPCASRLTSPVPILLPTA